MATLEQLFVHQKQPAQSAALLYLKHTNDRGWHVNLACFGLALFCLENQKKVAEGGR